ncbi:MAG: fibronectin type III domain-containing protein, partial [Actinomycetales bacterium]
AASSPRVSGTPVALPSAPQSVTATGADGSVSITWAAPSSDGGSAITGYTAEVFTAATGGSAVDTCVPASLSNLTCTSSGRTNGTTYYVSVKATNANGTGDASARVSVVAGAQASVPRSVAAVRGDGSITVSWQVPTSDGGSPITGYEANAYTSTSSSASVAASCTTTGLECTINSVSNSTVYYVSVAAITSVRTGAASARVTVAAAGTPGAPRSVTVTRADGYAVVKWTAPATTGGAAISRYAARA